MPQYYVEHSHPPIISPEEWDAVQKERLALLLETIGGTGIRVSEVKYITVKAAQNGRTEISLKGKIRTIMLPGKLNDHTNWDTMLNGTTMRVKIFVAFLKRHDLLHPATE